jgi:hypothetical protein
MDEQSRSALGQLGKGLQLDKPMPRRGPRVIQPPPLPTEKREVAVVLREQIQFQNNFFFSDNAVETELAPLMTPFEYCLYRRLYYDSFGGLGGMQPRRNYCRAGYDYLQRTTALQSRRAVINGIKGLLEKKLILRLDSDRLTPTGSLYRILRPHEVLSRRLEEGTALDELDEEVVLRGVQEGHAPEEDIAHEAIPTKRHTPAGASKLSAKASQAIPLSPSASTQDGQTEKGIAAQGRGDSPNCRQARSISLVKDKKREDKNQSVERQFLRTFYQKYFRQEPRQLPKDELEFLAGLVREHGEEFLPILQNELENNFETVAPRTNGLDLLRQARPYALIAHQRDQEVRQVEQKQLDELVESRLKEFTPQELECLRKAIKTELLRKRPGAAHWAPEVLDSTIDSQLRQDLRRQVEQRLRKGQRVRFEAEAAQRRPVR